MGTKQIQMKFQVAANNGVSAQVTIAVNGTQKFSGPLAQTVADIVYDQINMESQPYSLAQFDLDVTNLPTNYNDAPNDPYQYGGWVEPKDVTISVSGGDVCLQHTLANYVTVITVVTPGTGNTRAVYSCAPGNADTFQGQVFYNQPVWTPTADGKPNRLDYAAVDLTGIAGPLLILDNESVAYQLAVDLYSA